MSLNPRELQSSEPAGSSDSPVAHSEHSRDAETRVAVPRVSVIMSVYDGNTLDEVAAAASSILDQSFSAFEFLILNDGITRHELAEFLRELAAQDPRIQVIYSKDNRGIARSLNTLIQLARADYVAVMDSDDLSAPERIGRQFTFLQDHPGVDIVGCFAIEIDARGNEIFEKRLPVDTDSMSRFMCYRDPLVHPSVMYRKTLFDRLSYYSESPADAYFGDTDLWSRALLAGCGIANIPEPLYRFRRNESFLNRRRGWRFALAELRLRMQYIRQAGLPKRYLLWPAMVAIMRVCPSPILRWAYRYCRGRCSPRARQSPRDFK